MELQLGLALSSTPPAPPPIKGFDLNNFVDEATVCGSINDKYKKRSFAQAFDDGEHDKIGSITSATAVPRTLPLLLWNSEPNGSDDEEDDNNPNKRQHTNSSFTVVIKNDGDGLVGWPPIKSWRKEICFHHHHDNRCGGNRTAGNINGCGGGGGGRSGSSSNSSQCYYNSTFVKVKMEGVGIARKIDLSLHQSFQTLTDTLMDMFDKCQMDSNNYKLTYQDREGDWLLAQDVPWRSFIRSVQRLKLVKRSD